MYLSFHDPFVVSGIAMLGLLIIIAIILLTIVQRRSAEEVWDSVEKKPKSTVQTPASEGTSDTDRLVTPSQLESGMQPKRDDELTPIAQSKPAAKTVRFSEVIETHAPRLFSKDGFEPVPTRDSVDLGTASSHRVSVSEQQARELCFV
jgi:hypothetical protein